MINEYLSLFPGATRERPRFMALAEAVLRQACDLIAVIGTIGPAWAPEYAVGAQLDALCAGLGLSRADTPRGAGAPDGEYRAYLLEKLKLWCGDGTNGGA